MAGTKYHINPETGRPNKCTATVRGCAYAKDGMVPEHYDTKEEAQTAYEKQNKENTFKSLKKPIKSKVNNPIMKKKSIQADSKIKKDLGSLEASPTPSKLHYPLINDDGFIELEPLSNNNGSMYKLSEDGRLNVTFPSDMKVDKIDIDEYDHAVEQFTNRFARPVEDRGWYKPRAYRYATGIGDIDSYNADDYGVKFDGGSYYNPTPDEPYHGGDISYTTSPSFEVKDRKTFTEKSLEGYKEDTGIKVTYTKELHDDLDANGFYSGDYYEAVIGGDYYGDEFEGFIVNEDKAEKWGKILAIHSIAQLNNPDKVQEYWR